MVKDIQNMILTINNIFLLYFFLHCIKYLLRKSNISFFYLNNSQFLLKNSYYDKPKY